MDHSSGINFMAWKLQNTEFSSVNIFHAKVIIFLCAYSIPLVFQLSSITGLERFSLSVESNQVITLV